MCYINNVLVSVDTFIRYKEQQKELRHLQEALLIQPARRGFDYSDWPIIKPSIDGKDWNVVAMSWGFIPDYIKNQEDLDKMRKGYVGARGKFLPGKPMLNVKGDEMMNNQVYRKAALTHRCLILSSGFFEHQHVFEKGKSGKILKTAVKYPYHITIPEVESFLMAGIYNTWTDQDTGEVRDTFAILTTDANSLMAQVHNSKLRMPVILPDPLADRWSDPDLTEDEITQLGSFQFPADKMKAYPVAKDFLSAADPTVPFAYETLEALN